MDATEAASWKAAHARIERSHFRDVVPFGVFVTGLWKMRRIRAEHASTLRRLKEQGPAAFAPTPPGSDWWWTANQRP